MYPQSRLAYVTAGEKGKLATRAIRTEAIDVEAGWHHLFGDVAGLPEANRKVLENAHAVFSFVASPGDAWSGNVRSIVVPEVPVVHVAPRPAEGDAFAGHITQWIGDQLAVLPPVKTAFDQIMPGADPRRRLSAASPEGTVCVHPGGGAEKKRWPAKHFVQLVCKLVKGRRHVRVLIGEVEREQLHKEEPGALRRRRRTGRAENVRRVARLPRPGRRAGLERHGAGPPRGDHRDADVFDFRARVGRGAVAAGRAARARDQDGGFESPVGRRGRRAGEHGSLKVVLQAPDVHPGL